MVKMRIYSEFSFKAEMQLKDVDARTRDYDVQRHKVEIQDYLRKRLVAAFPDAKDLTLHYLEFSPAQE